RDEAVLARSRRLGRGTVAARLEPEDRACGAPGEVGELLPGSADFGRREAVVDEQDFRSGRAQQPRGVLLAIRRGPERVDGVLLAGDAEERAELGHRISVAESVRDVRPLARVAALREEAAELVERRRGA